MVESNRTDLSTGAFIMDRVGRRRSLLFSAGVPPSLLRLPSSPPLPVSSQLWGEYTSSQSRCSPVFLFVDLCGVVSQMFYSIVTGQQRGTGEKASGLHSHDALHHSPIIYLPAPFSYHLPPNAFHPSFTVQSPNLLVARMMR